MNLPYFMFVSYDHARMLDLILRRYEYNIVAMDHDKRTLILIKPGVDIFPCSSKYEDPDWNLYSPAATV